MVIMAFARRTRSSVTSLVVTAIIAAVTLAAGPPGISSAAATVVGPTLRVNAAAHGYVINPGIYGASFPTSAFASAARISLSRWGGNATTRYNWRTGNTNAGSDWFFENMRQGSGSAKPLDALVAAANAGSERTSIAVPVIGVVAKDATSCGFPKSTYPSQQQFDYWRPACGNGVPPSGSGQLGVRLPASQTSIAFPAADQRTMAAAYLAVTRVPPIFQLDNEPTLWNSTHHDVQPNPILATTLFARSTAAADAIHAGAPTAQISGPGDWGWCAYFFYPADNCAPGADRTRHGNLDLAAAYLSAFHAHDLAVKHRTLTFFDEHFYPQGTNVALSSADDPATDVLRLRSVRALWDPSYVDESWIGGTAYPVVQLLPRMRAWVNKYYPGTGISIGEYNFGNLDHINGALAQADVLGLFGRYGVSWAALWAPPTLASSPGAFAFRMFRNLDGRGAGFGTQSVAASSANQGQLSNYASLRADGTLTLVVINKTASTLTSSLLISGYAPATRAIAYRYSAANLKAITATAVAMSTTSAQTFPPNSITTLVIPRRPAAAPLVTLATASAGSSVPAGQPSAGTEASPAARRASSKSRSTIVPDK